VQRIKKKRPTRSRAARLIALLVGVSTLLALIYTQLRPAVESAAAYQVRLFAARVLNAAILEQLGEEHIAYGDLIRLSRNSSGEIVAIESDMVRINRLKADVNQYVISALEDMGTVTLMIPLGTLLGNEITSGRGPLVEIRVYPVGYVQTDLYSNFTEAGINQTLHQIMLGTRVQMRAIIPGYSIQADIFASYGIAETVIVGNIPEAYTQINLGSAPVIAQIGN